ncbi:transposase, partial [Burkholderia pseudomallei]|nr:transposase [Burkholderia pseudomallei]
MRAAVVGLVDRAARAAQISQIMYCEQCGARCQQIHETTVRRVRDLPLFEYRVVLHVPRRR